MVSRSLTALAAVLVSVSLVTPVRADDEAVMEKLNDLSTLVQQQQSQLNKLETKLSDRDKKIDELEKKLGKKEKTASVNPAAQSTQDQNIADVQATKTTEPALVQPGSTTEQAASTSSDGAEPEHVGEAPATPEKPPEVSILADSGGVLTPYGTVILEPFLEYSRSSVNDFVVQGVDVSSAALIGIVTANSTARDLVDTGVTLRGGVTNRLELEAKIPFEWRQDSFTNSVPNVNGQTTTQTQNGYGLGDIEVAAHYQINDGQEDWPFFIANMRVKTDTGSSPFDVSYDANNNPKWLATGTGFIAIEPSLTVIYPMDPAVLFANLGYVHSFDSDINKTVAGNAIGNVAPGDSYTASIGMGVALNDRLSFMLGYEQDYVRPTITMVSGSESRSDTLMVGSALTGFSFKVNDRVHVNFNLAAGVTRDAPDTVVTLRVPISFQPFGP